LSRGGNLTYRKEGNADLKKKPMEGGMSKATPIATMNWGRKRFLRKRSESGSEKRTLSKPEIGLNAWGRGSEKTGRGEKSSLF